MEPDAMDPNAIERDAVFGHGHIASFRNVTIFEKWTWAYNVVA